MPTPTPPPVVRYLPVRDEPPPAPPREPNASPRSFGPALWVGAAAALVLGLHRALAAAPLVAVASVATLVPIGETAALAPIGEAATSLARPPAAAQESAPLMPIRHEGHASIRGGVLFAPDSFETADGAYDLLLHFHGNTAAVRESAEVAGLDAIVAVVNLGIGSGAYQEAYGAPGSYEALLDDIDRAVAQRGVREPRLRRVALSSWSAGYGALSSILELRRKTDPLDAILVLDGIHCGWIDAKHETLNPRQLAPFAAAARAAAEGELLFSITHSEIDPISYAPAADTARYLLETVGGEVSRSGAAILPPHVQLKATEGVIVKMLEKRMEPTVEGRVGALRVRGFRGNTAEHHAAHLLQMGATVLPELASRWQR